MHLKSNVCILTIIAIIFISSSTAIKMKPTNDDERKIKLFYQYLENSLNANENFRMFSKRVECIIESLEEKNLFKTINESHYKFEQIGNSTEFEIKINNKDELMSELMPLVSSESGSCVVLGYFAMLFVTLILVVIVFLTFCLHKNESRWGKF